jgi:small subunit ribosomal protein S21e
MSDSKDNTKRELYIPRKCSASNTLITADDHSSVQLNIGQVDENGLYTGQFSTFALCGKVRGMGDGDQAINRLAGEAGLMRDMQSFPTFHKYEENDN